MPPLPLAQPIQHLLALLDTTPSRCLIGLAGAPGSGKSTLAAYLAAEVNARTALETAVALGMDGFHLTKAELRRMPDPDQAFARRGAPWTFDTEAFRLRLLALRESFGRAAVGWPGFEHAVGDPVEDAVMVAASTQLVIVEGLYLLHQADGWDAISRLFDERWYLDTPLPIALDRLAARHMRAWGMTHAEAAHRIASSDGLNADLVQATAPYADWMVLLPA